MTKTIVKSARRAGLQCLTRLPLMLMAALLVQDTTAATRRALIIGINDYASGGNGTGGRDKWTSLDGTLNDAQGLQEILVSKHGFPRENIVVLLNKQATRKNILSAYRSTLIDPVQKGDVCLFYYAGHGSQVNNSKTDEPDGKDETIVPADANTGEWDIRDKEIARLFNDTIDKDARLTVLFDSCHSGSIARGPVTGKARSIEPDRRDVADFVKDEKPDPRGRPESRENGALIMSAAQDHQLAYEAIDSKGLPHGSFSLALQRALIAGPAQSASSLYKRTRGLMQANGINQDPVMAGPPARFSQPLFGGAADSDMDATVVTVLNSSSSGVEVDGGRAVGLHEGCELVGVGDSSVRLEITSLDGLNRAMAKIEKGRSSDVRKGDLYKLDSWVAPDDAHLQAWIAPPLDFDTIVATAKAMEPVGTDSGIQSVREPTVDKPTHEMRWIGNEWILDVDGERGAKLGKSPSATDVIAAIKKTSRGQARFFLNLPPTAELKEAIGLENVDSKTAVLPAKSIEQAQYVLFGRISDGRPEYAWVQTAATLPGSTANTLPPRGDWLEMAKDRESARSVGLDLWGHAKALGRIRAWITLDGPPDSTSFPYDLRVKRLSSGKLMDGGDISEADEYQLVLVHNSPESKRVSQKRYVYVFVLDSFGNSTLMFPPVGQGNVENNVPYQVSQIPTLEIPLGDPFQIGPPYGLDTYVLLTSKEAIDSPDTVLDAQGIRTRGSAPTSALGSLLTDIGGSTRGAKRATPTSWSIERLSFNSKP